jgi:hypothetical protein
MRVCMHSCVSSSVCFWCDGRRWSRCSRAPQDGGTPLHNACFDGHLAVVEALLAKGADVEAKDNVSIARPGALCPSRSLAHIAHGVVP